MKTSLKVRSLTRTIRGLFGTQKGIFGTKMGLNPHKLYPYVYYRHYFFTQKLCNGIDAVARMEKCNKTAASAMLLKLDRQKTRMALGITASLAGGLRENFGTMTKPLNTGNSARNVNLAALLSLSSQIMLKSP